ncbi:hypothetical protein IOD06_09620 [Psychrobacter sp. N25K4-3-2]|uniref:hypothetical protein n=1 Tax=Psychrobacter sp. N25K4-3-2 TaxID=2785026 RepID=UPI00188C9B55|nr:hypothetical protein [Psychrobacter sp. N25K4-3-2]MBF4490144.1 hypothetical protein [Psychrobacter sp. N25K4-3-2]
MDKNEIDWYADIIPGKSIAGLEISKYSHQDIKALLKKSDKNNFHIRDNSDSFDIYSSDSVDAIDTDLLMRLSFNEQMILNSIMVYITRKPSQYQGKIYGKYGLGDRLINISEFGSLERTATGEEFLLINSDNKYGLEVANGLDVSLEEDPNQNIAIIRVHDFFR